MVKKKIYFEGSYDPNRQCIKISGNGAAEIKFITDASQLAPVLLSLADMTGCRIGIVLKKLPGSYPNDSKGKAKKPKTFH